MRTTWVSAVTVALAQLLVGVAAAAENPLEAIPDTAGVVVRLKTPDATLKKVAEFAGKADPSWSAIISQQGAFIGAMISNPSQGGVDPKGDWWVAVFPISGGEPGIVFAVPVTDHKAAQEAVVGAYQFAKYENWLLYTDHQETFKSLEGRIKGDGKSIVPVIDRESRAVVERSDAAAFVNVPQLRKTFRAELDGMKQQVEAMLEQLKDSPAQMQGMNIGAVFGIYGELFRGLMQAMEDTEGYTAGIGVGDGGLAIEQFVKVAEGSATDAFLRANATSEMKTLEKLPAGKLVYFGAHGDTVGMMKWGMKFSSSIFEGNEEAKKATEEAAAEMAQLKLGGYAGTFDLGDLKDGALRTTTVMEVEPAEKMRDIYRKITPKMGKLVTGPIKQEVTLETDAEKYGDRPADVMLIKQEFDNAADPQGIQKQVLESMYGPEGMVTRVVALKGMIVQTIGGGRPAMEELLKGLDGPGAGSGDARQAVRRHLAQESNLLVLVDLPGLVVKGLSLVAESGALPLPIDGEGLQKLEIPRSYLGGSVAAQPAGLRIQMQVPVEQFQGIAKLVQFFTRSMNALN